MNLGEFQLPSLKLDLHVFNSRIANSEDPTCREEWEEDSHNQAPDGKRSKLLTVEKLRSALAGEANSRGPRGCEADLTVHTCVGFGFHRVCLSALRPPGSGRRSRRRRAPTRVAPTPRQAHQLSPGPPPSLGTCSLRGEGLATLAGAQGTAHEVARKQLRVAGQERALPLGKLSAAATEAGTCKPQNPPGRRDPRSIPYQSRRDPRARRPACRRAHRSCLRTEAQQGAPGLLAAR